MNNGAKTVDKRVVRTKKAIRNAFTELLAEKDINYITVKDIAEHANINRKTFYNYYSGIYQVVEEMEHELVNNFEGAFSNVSLVKCLTEPHLIFDKIDAMLETDMEFYGNLFRMNENLDLITKITSLIKEKTKRSICEQLNLPEKSADVALEFAISGMVSVYQMWFRSDTSKPLSEVSEILGNVTFEGLKGLLKR